MVILVITAGGNLIYGLLGYLQNFNSMYCVRQALYNGTTSAQFDKCLDKVGFFDTGSATSWIFVQFILVIASILIASFLERRK